MARRITAQMLVKEGGYTIPASNGIIDSQGEKQTSQDLSMRIACFMTQRSGVHWKALSYRPN